MKSKLAKVLILTMLSMMATSFSTTSFAKRGVSAGGGFKCYTRVDPVTGQVYTQCGKSGL